MRMAQADAQSNPQALARDAFGTPLQNVDVPIDHPAFLAQRVYKNVGGDVVRIEMDFSKPGGGTSTFRKSFIPPSGDVTVSGNPLTIGPWTLV